MVEKWRSIKVREETYRNIVKLKSMGELATLKDFTMGDIVDDAVTMALEHVQEGLATWKRKRTPAQ